MVLTYISAVCVDGLGSSKLSSPLSLPKLCVFSGPLFLEGQGTLLILFYGSFSSPVSPLLLFSPFTTPVPKGTFPFWSFWSQKQSSVMLPPRVLYMFKPVPLKQCTDLVGLFCSVFTLRMDFLLLSMISSSSYILRSPHDGSQSIQASLSYLQGVYGVSEYRYPENSCLFFYSQVFQFVMWEKNKKIQAQNEAT